MAYIQNTSPPPTNVSTFNISTFYGGLNNRDSYIELADNESSDLLNIDFFSENGVVQKRMGYERYGTFEVVDTPITFMDMYKPVNDTEVLIRATASAVYADDASIKTTAGDACGRNFNDRYFFVDGDEIYVYGTFPQTADANTYVSVVGTSTTDRVVMKVINPTSGYTPLASPEVFGVTEYNYNDMTVQYQPCQYELDDEFKGTNLLPNNPDYIETKEGRLYIAGDDDDPHAVFLSDVQNPFYFPANLTLRLTPNGDEITALHEFHDAIIVGRKYDLHVIYGNTSRTDLNSDLFYLSSINSHTGIASNNTAVRVHNYLFYLGSDGNFYALNTPQTDTEVLSTTILNKKVDITSDPVNIDMDDITSSYSIFKDDIYWTSIGDKVLVYSYIYRSWSVYDGFNATSFLEMSDDELYFSSDAGKTFKYGVGYSDDGDAITCYWASKRFTMDNASRIKKFKQIYIVAQAYDDYVSDVKINFEIDYGEIETEYSIKSQISKWGSAVFGDRFIEWNIVTSLPVIINRRGRLIRFIFANDSVDEPFKLYELNGEFELKGFR